MRVRREVRRVPLLLGLMVLTSSFHVGQSVWSLSIPNQVYIVGSVAQFCNGMPELTQKQSDFCAENRDLMPSIRYGARLADKQCRYQFQYRRWNCSVPERDSNTLFRRITGKGTREAAFTYAIASAGVVHAIARACVEGNLSMCGCSRERRPKKLESEYQWGGCGDNIDSGAKYARKFMNAGEDSRETTKQERTLMNLHNNEVGILAVREKAQVSCKCHGVSGSCSIQTCKRELSLFKGVGDALHGRYDNAVRVRMERIDALNILMVVKRKKKGEYRRDSPRFRSTNKTPSVDSIVYVGDSPNYCVKSSRHEFPGTTGRTCNKDSYGSDSCEELCCGRGYRSSLLIIRSRCKCKFHWCCEIRCKECATEETRYTCK